MAVYVGELDRRITIKVNTPGIDDTGGSKDSTSDLTVWAKVEYKSGAERDTDGVIFSNANVNFIIRYRSVDLNDWVEYDGKRYDIERIEELGRRQWLKLFCNETTG